MGPEIFYSQELLDDSLFYTRREKELESRVKKLLECIDSDEFDDDEDFELDFDLDHHHDISDYDNKSY